MILTRAGTDSCIIMATHDAQQAERVRASRGPTGSPAPHFLLEKNIVNGRAKRQKRHENSTIKIKVLRVKDTLLLKHIFGAFVLSICKL